MAFIVEDSSGLPNATSFVSVEYADAYFLDRLNNEWSALTIDQKKSALIQGTSFIDMVYGDSFNGEVYLSTQSLCFPRLINGEKSYPDKLLRATCEASIRASSGELLTDVGEKVTERTVGPLTTKYAEYSNTQTQYSSVYHLLKPYLNGSSSSRKVVRA